MKRIGYKLLALLVPMCTLMPVKAFAANASSGFSLQVSPSPIVLTVKPGETSTVDVQIRNTGTTAETLKIGLRSFTVSKGDGAVTLQDQPPKNVQDWVTFADPEFTVQSGTLFTEKVTFAVPTDAGFNYSFALLVSRAQPTAGAAGKTAIEGSVAIFTLLSVDRPGATKKVEVVSFSSKKKVYEFLPGEFTLNLKNSGNTIVAPTGNIFIQRSQNAASPLAVLPINATGAYILPDVSRSVSSEWKDGFPVYKKGTDNKNHLTWDWGTLQKMRIGHFYAKAVIIYSDGTRDIPVEVSIGFWVIPWRLLISLFVVLLLIVVGVITILRKTAKLAHKHEKDEAKKA